MYPVIPDIIVNIKFYKTNEGGRQGPTPPDYFSVIFDIDSKKHDCRLFLFEIGSIFPGDFKENIPIKFLCWDLVFPKIYEGKTFHLWEGRFIAEGTITKIIRRGSGKGLNIKYLKNVMSRCQIILEKNPDLVSLENVISYLNYLIDLEGGFSVDISYLTKIKIGSIVKYELNELKDRELINDLCIISDAVERSEYISEKSQNK